MRSVKRLLPGRMATGKKRCGRTILGTLRRPGRALDRPTWSLVKGSSASLPQSGSATVVPQRFFGIPATDSDMADVPRPDEIPVVMAIADGGRLRNRCGTEPIR